MEIQKQQILAFRDVERSNNRFLILSPIVLAVPFYKHLSGSKIFNCNRGSPTRRRQLAPKFFLKNIALFEISTS